MNCKTWREILNRVPEKNLSECFNKLAKNWETCAIGHKIGLDNTLLMREHNIKIQNTLTRKARELGNDFYYAIEQNDKKLALQILDKIEALKRVTKKSPKTLIKEIEG